MLLCISSHRNAGVVNLIYFGEECYSLCNRFKLELNQQLTNGLVL